MPATCSPRRRAAALAATLLLPLAALAQPCFSPAFSGAEFSSVPGSSTVSASSLAACKSQCGAGCQAVAFDGSVCTLSPVACGGLSQPTSGGSGGPACATHTGTSSSIIVDKLNCLDQFWASIDVVHADHSAADVAAARAAFQQKAATVLAQAATPTSVVIDNEQDEGATDSTYKIHARFSSFADRNAFLSAHYGADFSVAYFQATDVSPSRFGSWTPVGSASNAMTGAPSCTVPAVPAATGSPAAGAILSVGESVTFSCAGVLGGSATLTCNTQDTFDQPAPTCTVPCAAGFASATGNAPCSPCSPGSAASSPGATECALCGLNTFAPNFAQELCSPCPAGHTAGMGAAQCAFDCPTLDGWGSLNLNTTLEPILDIEASGFLSSSTFEGVFHLPKKFDFVSATFGRTSAISTEQVVSGVSSGLASTPGLVGGLPSACFTRYAVSVDWATLLVQAAAQQVLERDETHPDFVSFTVRNAVEVTEDLVVRNVSIKRTDNFRLPMRVRFERRVTASLGQSSVQVYGPPLVSAVLTLQAAVMQLAAVTADVEIKLLTVVQHPFQLCTGNPAHDGTSPLCAGFQPSVAIPSFLSPATTAFDPTDANNECIDAPAAGAGQTRFCKQIFRFTFSLDPNDPANGGNPICELDSDQYYFHGRAACQPSKSGATPENLCPLCEDASCAGENTDVVIRFSLDSENLCPQVVDQVDLSAELKPYKTTSWGVSLGSYKQGDRIHFLATASVAQNAVEIAKVSISEIELITASSNGFATVYTAVGGLQGQFTGPAAAGLDFESYDSDTAAGSLPFAFPDAPRNAEFEFSLVPAIFEAPADSFEDISLRVTLQVHFAGFSLLQEHRAGVQLLGQKLTSDRSRGDSLFILFYNPDAHVTTTSAESESSAAAGMHAGRVSAGTLVLALAAAAAAVVADPRR